MITIKKMILLLILTVFGLTACQKKQTIEIRNDFKKYYDQFQVEGSFVLYDPQTAKYIFYNQDQYKQTFSPASTFKICNSLIGLETGVIQDENYIIPWDSVTRNPVWDKDHDMKTAFANSTVWYYQELAKRVGGQKMKYWLDKTNYGNADTSGGIDRFWLTGGLRISPEQQIDFLKRLHDKKLPFSLRSTDIVKRIMITRDTLDYVIRAKKGWGGHESKEVGWYVGYIETNGNVYYFSNCIQMESEKLNDVHRAGSFDHARKEIVFKILEELKLTSK
ncbi:MAG: class D beta-lactamase [Saprospiraceae bacterium]|nr:class D beta-lactamase [Saprospiraceae bacterium]